MRTRRYGYSRDYNLDDRKTRKAEEDERLGTRAAYDDPRLSRPQHSA